MQQLTNEEILINGNEWRRSVRIVEEWGVKEEKDLLL
jgi:hypothetical protein